MQRINNLDLLRGLATLYIVGVWHIDDYAGDLFLSPLTVIMTFGALSIFVFISSFILSKKYYNLSTLKEVGYFYSKRILKIYPLYLSALILYYLTAQISFKTLFAGVFLMNGVLNINIKTLWFISMIFIYYMLLPLILSHYSILKLILISFGFLSLCVGLHLKYNLIDSRWVSYFPPFALGVICAQHNRIYEYIKNKGSSRK
jgi:peptidoglycan/LPS O-acetylase OafA/YrhL